MTIRVGNYACGAALAAFLPLLCALPAPALAAGGAGTAELSPRLAELASPALRTAPRAKQAEELDLARRGPGSLLRAGERVLVEVRLDRGSGVGWLRAAGARVLAAPPGSGTATVAARPAELRRLAAAPGVAAVTEVLEPVVHASGDGPGAVGAATVPCFGAATSEGDEQLRTAQAREEFALDGSGEKVGILSDSFDRDDEAVTDAAGDVASGDLPGTSNPCGRTGPVQILSDPIAGSDEGRGMAQIVHDLAPGAELSFATAFTGLNAFADNVRALADAGASVIVDDVSYFEEPFFQEGPVGVAVSDVTEGGATYFSSAGNDNLISGGNDIPSWEAPGYRDSGGCPAAVVALSEQFEDEEFSGLNPTHCLDFDPGGEVDTTFGLTVSPGATLRVDLQWAEPWEGVASDLDAVLLGPGGSPVAGAFEDNVGGSQRPFEFLAWENDTGSSAEVELAINRFSGATPRVKFVLLQNGGGVTGSEYPESTEGDIVGPAIFGHNGAEQAMSLGAIRYNASSAPEAFSSRGPVTHYFDPVDGSTPAEPLAEALQLAKPDVIATDGGANTFFGTCAADVWRFFGTSAAAPHAAAVAALEQEAEPGATPEEVKDAQIESAVAVGAFGPGAVGAGRVDAVGAIQQLGVAPAVPGAEPAPAPGDGPCFPSEPDPDPEPEPEPSPGEDDDSDPEESTPVIVPVPAPPAATDVLAPRTFFRSLPRKTIRTRFRRGRAVFRFRSDEAGALFLCQFDRKRRRRCGPRFVRWFRPGGHVLRVRARDAAGNVDRTPAVYRFRVKRVGR